MAVLNGQHPQLTLGGVDNIYLGTFLDGFEWVDIPQESEAERVPSGSELSASWPVEANGREIDAQRLNAYVYDFYYRIHISPSILALGNLLSSQTRDVSIWNAYLEPKLLQSVVSSEFDGITLTEPEPAPTYFAALEERTYQVNISTNGPPIIDANVLFNFVEANSPLLTITGRRVVIWPLKPLVDYVEKLEWKTDVIPTFEGEQRLALRMAPRQQLNHRFHLDQVQFSRLKAINTQWSSRVYGLPIWSEATIVHGIEEGAEEILLDTAFADYRPDSLIIVWESDVENEAIEITEVHADRLILRLPMPRAFVRAYVAPMRFVRTLGGTDFSRIGAGHTFVSASFDVTDNIDLSAAGDFTQYRGLDVLLDCPLLLTDISERIARSVDVFDNGSGVIEVDVQNDYVQRLFTVTFDSHSREDRWHLRQFLHRIKGRRGTFWLPSWNLDLQLAAIVTNVSISMQVVPINYPLYYGVTDIMVELISGSRYFNRVLAGARVDDVEVLSLQNNFPVTIQPSEVKRISFMNLLRFDSDSIELHHVARQIARTVVPAREVPA